jgi:hypothetical protein
VRGFFNVYFLAAMATAAGTAISYAFLGRPGFAVGAAALGLAAAGLRQNMLPKLDRLRLQIVADDAAAIRRFQKIHLSLLLSNLLQLVLLVWSLTKLSL